jgi:hypothetical protein
MTGQFDAIDYSQQLQAVGVSQTQAETHARLLSQALANCAATRAELAELKGELDARMGIFEVRMKEFKAGVKLELAEMRIEIANMRSEMRSEIKYNRRMIYLVLALQVALIVKMFPRDRAPKT